VTEPLAASGTAARGKGTGKPLFLYCGAGIRVPVEEINRLFTEQTGIRVEPTFTGSGCLLAQIEIADKGDLFMPGEDWFMKQAQERGRIIECQKVAYFVPVLMVQRHNPQGIRDVQDLLRPGLRVGVGEPRACAIGHFTVKLLQARGIPWEEFSPHVTTYYATAPELGNAIKLKAVDACVQWDSIAALYLDDADIVPLAIDEKTCSAIMLGVLKTAVDPEAAMRYLHFVASHEGEGVFRKHHFTVDLEHPAFPLGEVTAP
jgi:molybdate transport system substrate-binding protein